MDKYDDTPEPDEADQKASFEESTMKLVADYYDTGQRLAEHVSMVFNITMKNTQVIYGLQMELVGSQERNRELAAALADLKSEIEPLRENAGLFAEAVEEKTEEIRRLNERIDTGKTQHGAELERNNELNAQLDEIAYLVQNNANDSDFVARIDRILRPV